jgi:hypothetical protein
MATREKRLSQFSHHKSGVLPPEDAPMELLCEDNSGTYAVPYVCHWSDGLWRNSKTGMAIEADVVGWRDWGDRSPSLTPTGS